MKRNWDLRRNMLLDIENDIDIIEKMKDESEQEKNSINHHLKMLIDNDYIEGFEIINCYGSEMEIFNINQNITMNGYDFLDNIRHENIWNKIKAEAKTKGVNLTINVIYKIAEFVIMNIISN
jgi:hypothetical protein